eukprot:3799283-Alexandrium_andersonii.AAC.1
MEWASAGSESERQPTRAQQWVEAQVRMRSGSFGRQERKWCWLLRAPCPAPATREQFGGG